MPAAPRPSRAMTKTALIHETLRRGILDLEYGPGEYLNIDELARRHHVSPIPVREAIARLVEERLVVMRPHIGAEVHVIDESSVRETFALLEGLETAATRDIVARANPDDAVELGRILDGIDDLRLPADLARWDEANAAFHLRLATIAALPALLENLRRVFDHWDRIRRHFSGTSSNRGGIAAQREHRSMVGALRKKDDALLRKLLHRHNERARQTYLNSLSQPP
jgi:DNA-binding GntR family transcriptional regulator